MNSQSKNHPAKRKILIVDDSEINRSLLSDMLSDEYDIVEAENGFEATTILHNREHEFSLMLLDIVMPVMDGFEVLTVMNQNEWIKSVPVVMISADNVPTSIDRAYDLGVLDYITRPFDERIVRRRVISTIMLSVKQKELAYMVAEQIREKEESNRLMIEVLSNIVEFRNGESGLHVLHIRMLTELLLKTLLLKTDQYPITNKDIPLICNASALHDIGKIAVPEGILNKPGRFTKEEFEIMKSHSLAGANILKNIPQRKEEPLIQMGYQICRWHHERYDGKGYPDGLKGEEIPIAAQVVALADVYDALTSKRVYKDAYSHEKAIQMILNGECGVFNPLLLECLTDISDTLKEEFYNKTSVEQTSHQEIMSTVERIMDKGGLDISERTIKLLEHERMKSQYFASLSKEIQFEYNATSEMFTLSEWGVKYLDLPEIIMNPRESAFGTEVFTAKDFGDLMDQLRNTTPEMPMIEKEYLLTIKGQSRWNKVYARSTWSDEEEPEYIGAIGKIVDVHEDKEHLDRLEVRAAHDSLTGLLNHSTARSRISSLLKMRDEDKDAILILFDLDHFKSANDRYGHLFGDEVLKHTAHIIKESTRSADIAARMGGDEFLIYMEFHSDMHPLVNRIFHALTTEYRGFPVRVSMGVSSARDCGGNYENLFHMADEALYAAKRKGRNTYCFYDVSTEVSLDKAPQELTETAGRENQTEKK